jgi:hypothetical protein
MRKITPFYRFETQAEEGLERKKYEGRRASSDFGTESGRRDGEKKLKWSRDRCAV